MLLLASAGLMPGCLSELQLAPDGSLGACALTSLSENLSTDIDPNAASLAEAISTFIAQRDSLGLVAYSRLSNPYVDLSNNYYLKSEGDFSNVVAGFGCFNAGCLFPSVFNYNDQGSFVAEYRGFVYIDASEANIPLHIGVLADGAFAVKLCAGFTCDVILEHPLNTAVGAYRQSTEVIFPRSGAFQIQMFFVHLKNDAMFELSYKVGSFDDVDGPADTTASFSSAGFTLLPIYSVRDLLGLVCPTSSYAPSLEPLPETCGPRDVGFFCGEPGLRCCAGADDSEKCNNIDLRGASCVNGCCRPCGLVNQPCCQQKSAPNPTYVDGCAPPYVCLGTLGCAPAIE